MKILFNCPTAFMLAHGGAQIQIERTMAFLQPLGLEVEPMRWWDDLQKGDVIHFFGRMPAAHIELAHQKGIKVVMQELLTATGSRTPRQLWLQKTINTLIERFAPVTFLAPFNWNSYRLADVVIAMTSWEAHLMNYLFGAPKERIVIVPNGVEAAFFQSAPAARGEWLVCTSTITPRKRVLEVARAAVQAQTPLWIIGKAYAESDPYAREFQALAARESKLIRCGGPPMKDRAGLARIYREARGFVLLSAMETRSLAAEEAAVCECPLLLSDLPWARSVFGGNVQYCPITTSERTAKFLRRFYDEAPRLKPPPRPLRESDIAQQLKSIYGKVTGKTA